jgi:hypothetical protein
MNNALPPEMLANGRNPDPTFEPNEELYIRFDQMDGKAVSPICIKCPQSSNRSKYSQPEWVLLCDYPKFVNFGYGSIQVCEIPPELTSDGNIVFAFKPTHAPLDDNYSHTDIEAFKEGQCVKRLNNKKLVARFRILLSQKIQIIRFPQTS